MVKLIVRVSVNDNVPERPFLSLTVNLTVNGLPILDCSVVRLLTRSEPPVVGSALAT